MRNIHALCVLELALSQQDNTGDNFVFIGTKKEVVHEHVCPLSMSLRNDGNNNNDDDEGRNNEIIFPVHFFYLFGKNFV